MKQGQRGGGTKAPEFDSLVPYLTAYGVKTVTRSTLVPAGLVRPHTDSGIPYWEHIQIGSVMRPEGLKALNRSLASYRRDVKVAPNRD